MREYTIDIIKGIFIISMLIGHYNIDPILRRTIYSCHMVGFIFFSGYFYRRPANIKIAFYKLVKSFLVPYVIYCLCHFLIHLGNMSASQIFINIKTYIFAMSFSKNVFQNVPSIGPVYFIILLFCIRILYIFVDKLSVSMASKFAIVLGISFLGMLLGNLGVWLPWSLDCAMYALIFYYLGICFCKYNLLKFFSDNNFLYFLLSTVWAYMIYICSMELAVRQYEPYGLVVIGAISGILLIYMLSNFIKENIPCFISVALCYIGENTLYILIVHSLLNEIITNFWKSFFSSNGFVYMTLNIITQLIFGILTGMFFTLVVYKKRLDCKTH